MEGEEILNNSRNSEDEILGSSLTMEKVATAKKFIENHYKTWMKSIQERKERCSFFFFFPINLSLHNCLVLYFGIKNVKCVFFNILKRVLIN